MSVSPKIVYQFDIICKREDKYPQLIHHRPIRLHPICCLSVFEWHITLQHSNNHAQRRVCPLNSILSIIRWPLQPRRRRTKTRNKKEKNSHKHKHWNVRSELKLTNILPSTHLFEYYNSNYFVKMEIEYIYTIQMSEMTATASFPSIHSTYVIEVGAVFVFIPFIFETMRTWETILLSTKYAHGTTTAIATTALAVASIQPLHLQVRERSKPELSHFVHSLFSNCINCNK